MTEETLESRLKTMEPKMVLAGNLDNILKSLDKSPSVSEKASLYDAAARLASRGDEEEYSNSNSIFKNLNDAYAYTGIDQTTSYAFEDLKKDYDDNKDAIVSYITQELNKNLKGAKDKPEAAYKIAYALLPLIDIEETQEKVDRQTKEKFRKVTGMAEYFADSLTGNPERRDIRYRLFAADLINEEEKDGGKLYTINEEGIAKIVDNIKLGTKLYLHTKQGPPKND